MNQADMLFESPSYFWSCVTFSEDCPFFSKTDPKLYYFGFILLGLYAAFLTTIIADLRFWWSTDAMQRQVDYYVNLVRKKVQNVEQDQRRLMSTQERTEKQMKKCEECTRVVAALRYAAGREDPGHLTDLTAPSSITPYSGTNADLDSRDDPLNLDFH